MPPRSYWIRVAHWALVIAMLAPACSGSPRAGDIQFETVQMTLKDKRFTMEVADTEEKRERGLMYRETMAADHGMIFVFETADKIAFWMKDTNIPLDLVFLDSSGKIVGIYSLKPLDETPVAPDSPALYALELNADTAKSIGLKTGDTLRLPEKVLKGKPRSDEK